MPNLTKPTNSLFSNIMANSQHPTPEVGMGATRLGWTDRHPYTIIEVLGPKRIKVQSDNATRVDKNGMSECQEYLYEPDPTGGVEEVTLRKNGRWVTKGESQGQGTAFALGYRKKYHDFSF